MAKITVRSWATPLTLGAFLLMSVTGVLMFLEWEPGQMTVAHEWFSWLFLAGAGAHIAVNIRPFKNHLKSHWGRSSIAVFTLILTASAFSWGMITGPQLKRPIEQALVEAPLAALAGIAGLSPDALLARLAARGIVANGRQSIAAASAASGIDENRLLAIIFLKQ